MLNYRTAVVLTSLCSLACSTRAFSPPLLKNPGLVGFSQKRWEYARPLQNRRNTRGGKEERSSLRMQQRAEESSDQLAVPLTLLRIAAGVLMIHHGSEGGLGPANIGTEPFNGFVEFVMKPYFSWLPGSLVAWAAIHDVIEFVGGILLAAGFLTRYAAAALSGTMLFAVYFHLASTGLEGFPLGHVKNYSYNFEEPALYLFIFATFAFGGAGPFSVCTVACDLLRRFKEAGYNAEMRARIEPCCCGLLLSPFDAPANPSLLLSPPQVDSLLQVPSASEE